MFAYIITAFDCVVTAQTPTTCSVRALTRWRQFTVVSHTHRVTMFTVLINTCVYCRVFIVVLHYCENRRFDRRILHTYAKVVLRIIDYRLSGVNNFVETR